MVSGDSACLSWFDMWERYISKTCRTHFFSARPRKIWNSTLLNIWLSQILKFLGFSQLFTFQKLCSQTKFIAKKISPFPDVPAGNKPSWVELFAPEVDATTFHLMTNTQERLKHLKYKDLQFKQMVSIDIHHLPSNYLINVIVKTHSVDFFVKW